MLVIGASGVGKTRLVGEIAADPRITRVALVTFEKGTKSIRVGREKIEVFEVPTVDPKTGDIETLFKSLEKARVTIKNAVRDGKFDVVVLDPLSIAAKIALDDIRAPVVNKAIENGLLPPKIEWDEYGRCTTMISAFIRQFKALPCHFLATCHVKVDTDDKTGLTSMQGDMTASLMRDLPTHFDCVLYMVSEETKVEGKTIQQRKLICQQKGLYPAKNRGDRLPPTLIGKDVAMSHIFDLLDTTD